MTRSTTRKITPKALTPALKLTGFRFSRLYRHEATRFHAFIYRWVDTVGANAAADGFEA